MLSNIYYFVDENGDNPVKERAKVFAYIAELKAQGHNLRRPMADYLKDGIYELRPKANRVFYFFFLKHAAVLLHAIRKKTDKVPEKDMELCIKRKQATEALTRVENVE